MDLTEATAVLNRVFEDYLIPLAFSTVQMNLHLEANQIDRSLSPIWYDDDGTLAAAGTLAVRETRGWIGGFGVAPPYRGRGLARALLESIVDGALERGLRSIQLEVLTENARAIATYRRGGFTALRTLETFRWVPRARTHARAGIVSAAPFLDRYERVVPCWQREIASLRSQPDLCCAALAEDAYAVFRQNRSEAQILKIEAQSSEAVAALVSSIAEVFEVDAVTLFNEPSEGPIAGYVRTLAWERTFAQLEMLRTLA